MRRVRVAVTQENFCLLPPFHSTPLSHSLCLSGWHPTRCRFYCSWRTCHLPITPQIHQPWVNVQRLQPPSNIQFKTRSSGRSSFLPGPLSRNPGTQAKRIWWVDCTTRTLPAMIGDTSLLLQNSIHGRPNWALCGFCTRHRSTFGSPQQQSSLILLADDIKCQVVGYVGFHIEKGQTLSANYVVCRDFSSSSLMSLMK